MPTLMRASFLCAPSKVIARSPSPELPQTHQIPSCAGAQTTNLQWSASRLDRKRQFGGHKGEGRADSERCQRREISRLSDCRCGL